MNARCALGLFRKASLYGAHSACSSKPKFAYNVEAPLGVFLRQFCIRNPRAAVLFHIARPFPNGYKCVMPKDTALCSPYLYRFFAGILALVWVVAAQALCDSLFSFYGACRMYQIQGAAAQEPLPIGVA